MRSDSGDARPPLAIRRFGALAAAKLVLHALLSSSYGFHRDELYYLACGRHLAWCYVDHPLLTPLVARAVEALAGPSLIALRLVVAALGSALVFLAGVLARELGGRSRSQGLAALAVLVSPVFLMTNGLFQTVSFDQLAWVAACCVLARALRDDRPQLLVALGAIVGLGLLAKSTIAVFALALFAALLATRRRTWLATRWAWIGALLAAAGVAVGALWQAQHGWPTLEFVAQRGARSAAEFPPSKFLALQLVFIGPFSVPLFAAGLAGLARRRTDRIAASLEVFRPFAIVFALALALFVARGGKPYYIAPLYPVVFAAGAVWLERAVEHGRWRRTLKFAPAILVLGAAPLVWMTTPIVPRAVFAAHQDAWPHKDFAEMFGWPELVEQLARARDALDAAEQREVGVLCDSYGEAAAVEVLGRAASLPHAASPHNQFYFWGPPRTLDGAEPGVVLFVTGSRAYAERLFEQVEDGGAITNEFGVRNEASTKRVFVCRKPRAVWSDAWPLLRSFV